MDRVFRRTPGQGAVDILNSCLTCIFASALVFLLVHVIWVACHENYKYGSLRE